MRKPRLGRRRDEGLLTGFRRAFVRMRNGAAPFRVVAIGTTAEWRRAASSTSNCGL